MLLHILLFTVVLQRLMRNNKTIEGRGNLDGISIFTAISAIGTLGKNITGVFAFF